MLSTTLFMLQYERQQQQHQASMEKRKKAQEKWESKGRGRGRGRVRGSAGRGAQGGRQSNRSAVTSSTTVFKQMNMLSCASAFCHLVDMNRGFDGSPFTPPVRSDEAPLPRLTISHCSHIVTCVHALLSQVKCACACAMSHPHFSNDIPLPLSWE